MTDATWTLSMRESGQGSDTVVDVNSLRGSDVLEVRRDDTQTVRLDFSYDVAGWTDNRTRFETARKLLAYAHTGARGVDDGGIPWYREKLPESAPVDSQVVELSPSSDLSDLSFRGVWAIVVGGQADAPLGVNPVLQLDLFVLSEDSDYADRSAVEIDLGESI